MNDYVETLRKKAREIAKKRAVLLERLRADQEELVKLQAAESGIVALLRLEGVATDAPGSSGPTSEGKPPLPKAAGPLVLSDVLKQTLADGRVRHVDELIEAAKAKGIEFGEKNPWRTVNFTLMGISSGKTIERVEGDRWRRAS